MPYMFDAGVFMDKAQAIAKERADAQAKAELEELQGMTQGTMMRAPRKGVDDEDEEAGEEKKMDRETVEKSMIHVFQVPESARACRCYAS